MKAVAKAAMDEFGRIDVLINNAGIMPLSFLKNLHEDRWEQTIDVNIKGVQSIDVRKISFLGSNSDKFDYCSI